MKHTHLALARLALTLAVTSLTATPVIAASLTMLQFGSFETRDEADKRLTDIKSKYAATIGNLPTSVREIKLPPDNLTVYRTQAGPVATRADAQGICTKLSSSGDECYIVQTAMVAGDVPAVAAAATTAPAVAANSVLPDTQSLLSDEKKGSTDLTSKFSSLKDVPARDASNEVALNSVSSGLTEPAATAAVADAAAGTPSPKMQSALDHAVAVQDTTDNAVTATTTSTAAKATKPGFWSHLNPFSSSTPAKPVAAAAPAVSPLSAPVDSVTSSAVDAPVVAAAATTPIIVAAATPSVVTRSEPVKPLPSFDNAPVVTQAEPMRLPPPPAPLKAQDRAELASGVQASRTPVPTGVIAAPAVSTAPGNGTVNVEEAKRVPLTETTVPAAPTVQAMPDPIRLQPPVSLSPTATIGQKTLWAQIGPFTDAQTALEYWGSYRQNHPDFPVVRVRVTSSYQQALHGVNQSWLRIGPVARMGFINSLCGSLYPKGDTTPADKQLRCGSVTDLGIASSQQLRSGMLAPSRYKR